MLLLPLERPKNACQMCNNWCKMASRIILWFLSLSWNFPCHANKQFFHCQSIESKLLNILGKPQVELIQIYLSKLAREGCHKHNELKQLFYGLYHHVLTWSIIFVNCIFYYTLYKHVYYNAILLQRQQAQVPNCIHLPLKVGIILAYRIYDVKEGFFLHLVPMFKFHMTIDMLVGILVCNEVFMYSRLVVVYILATEAIFFSFFSSQALHFAWLHQAAWCIQKPSFLRTPCVNTLVVIATHCSIPSTINSLQRNSVVPHIIVLAQKSPLWLQHGQRSILPKPHTVLGLGR